LIIHKNGELFKKKKRSKKKKNLSDYGKLAEFPTFRHDKQQ